MQNRKDILSTTLPTVSAYPRAARKACQAPGSRGERETGEKSSNSECRGVVRGAGDTTRANKGAHHRRGRCDLPRWGMTSRVARS